MIAWCRGKVTSHFSNFCFQVADVSNRNFNPTGCLRPTEYRLPYPDASFDVVHLRSVFTHMGPREVEHYLGEIARVLAPGGRCLATYFLLNRESLAMMQSLPVRQFPSERRECIATRGEERALSMATENGSAYRVSEPGEVGAVAHLETLRTEIDRVIGPSGRGARSVSGCGAVAAPGSSNQDIVVLASLRERVRPTGGTTMNRLLSDEQVERYWEDGILFPLPALGPKETAYYGGRHAGTGSCPERSGAQAGRCCSPSFISAGRTTWRSIPRSFRP